MTLGRASPAASGWIAAEPARAASTARRVRVVAAVMTLLLLSLCVADCSPDDPHRKNTYLARAAMASTSTATKRTPTRPIPKSSRPSAHHVVHHGALTSPYFFTLNASWQRPQSCVTA